MPKKLITRAFFEAEDMETRASEEGKTIVSGYAAKFELCQYRFTAFVKNKGRGFQKQSCEKGYKGVLESQLRFSFRLYKGWNAQIGRG